MSEGDGYWTPEREVIWEHLDNIAEVVEDKINQMRTSHREVRLHASAPNSNGINADQTPDAWYWHTREPDINHNTAAKLLTHHVAGDVTARETPDKWGSGYWFVYDTTDCPVYHDYREVFDP